LNPETCFLDTQVVRPTTSAEIGDIVRRASSEAQSLFPLGGRTMLDLGLPPSRPGVGVDLTALDRVIDYPARDMTITVEAGITIQRLREILHKEGQRLPIDVPASDRATLGGAVAANVSGPRRYGFGTLRDYVIGISVINDLGQETKAGGRVVKNVAGYDLCKLHVGALGTLGIISQATLKLKPLPEEAALVVCRCQVDELENLLNVLHAGRTRPVCIDVLNPRAAAELWPAEPAWAVIVGFEESGEAVRWQVQQLIKEMSACRTQGIDALACVTAEPVWQFLCDFQLRPEATLSFKANMLPHAVAGFCRLADGLDDTMRLQAHAGNGIVVGHVSGGLTVEKAGAMLKQIYPTALQGNVVILRCPTAWKGTLPVWGQPRGDAALMAVVRDKLDPRRLFNPGRFLV
jgi:glycolate oxidase FAD binding subunit